jgi:NAD(P)H-dependent flavin oxidoreductase YrpB (nitropropane dioxygenase family)
MPRRFAARWTDARPAVVSFALADRRDLAWQANDAGSLVMLQITMVAQAIQAMSAGADGSSAGRRGGRLCWRGQHMTFIPQVADVVSPIPVVTAGSMFDARGIVASGAAGSVSAPA